MDEPTIAPVWIVVPLAIAFAVNMVAEWILLSSEKRFYVALGKSFKAIIPALIALYALIIANFIVTSNG